MAKIIPYLNMNARATIGNISLPAITSFKINEDIKEIGRTATLVFPRALKKIKDKGILEYIKVGDPVLIEAGYNGNYKVEFKGYAARISAEYPVTVECEDFYWLRQNSFVKSYPNCTLKQLLSDIMPGYELDVPDLNLGKITLDKNSAWWELREIQKKYGLYTRMDEVDDNGLERKKVTVGLLNDWQSYNNVRLYDLQKNVKRNNLKWRRAGDIKVCVILNYQDADGKKHSERFGDVEDESFVIKKTLTRGLSKIDVQNAAQNIYKSKKYDGFEGNIIGFGTPLTRAGDSLKIETSLYPDRSGTYIIEKVQTEFSERGFSRTNTIAQKIA